MNFVRIQAGSARVLALCALAMVCGALSTHAASAVAPVLMSQEGGLSPEQLRYALAGPDADPRPPTRRRLDAMSWRQVQVTPVNLANAGDAAWFHTRIHNDGGQRTERYLQVGNILIDTLQFYVFDGDTLVATQATSEQSPFRDRFIQHRNFLQELPLEAGATLDVFMHVEADSALRFPIAIWRDATLFSNALFSSLLTGIFYGALFIMLLYNFAIGIQWRDSNFLHHALYLSSLAAFFLCLNGIAEQYLWPDSPALTSRATLLCQGLTLLFASLFQRQILALRSGRPLLDWLVLGVAALSVSAIAAALYLPHHEVLEAMMLLSVLASIVAMICGLIRLYDRAPSAGMFVLSWLALWVTGIAIAADRLGWIVTAPNTEMWFQLSVLQECLLLSLALTRQLNTDRRRATFPGLNPPGIALREQARQELERQIRLRTRELREANKRLFRQSTTDPLTGLKNRRFFNERFGAEFARSKRDGTALSALIIDIDHFKAVNDTHGHLAGDSILIKVAGLIAAEARRESDIVARYGGEEFLVVLVNNTPAQARDIADRIRVQIERAHFHTEQQRIGCTVSIGVATIKPEKGDAAETLIKQADTALYRAKADGRNRVAEFCPDAMTAAGE